MPVIYLLLAFLLSLSVKAENGSMLTSQKELSRAQLICQISGEKNQGHYVSFSSAGAVLVTTESSVADELKMDIYADLSGVHKESFNVHPVESGVFLIYRDQSGETELTVHSHSIQLKDQVAEGYLGTLRVVWNAQVRKFVIKCINPKEAQVKINSIHDLND